MSVVVTRYNITRIKCDAIVNPIGSGLYSSELADLACGKSKVASVSDMPYKFVIHTANPMWRVSSVDRSKVLDFTYKDALEVAMKQGFKSVTVPLVTFPAGEGNTYLALDKARLVLEHVLAKLVSRYKLNMHIYVSIIEERACSKHRSLLSEIERYVNVRSGGAFDAPYSEGIKRAEYSKTNTVGGSLTSGKGYGSVLKEHEEYSLDIGRKPRQISDVSSISGFDDFSEYAFVTKKSVVGDDKKKRERERGIISSQKLIDKPDTRPRIAHGESGSVLWEDDFDFENGTLDKFINKRLKNESFAKALFEYIDKRDIKDSDAYKNARVSKQTFSKIKNASYNPSKATVLLFALGLRLTIEETEHLLSTAGFCLSSTNKIDIIVEFFIRSGKYNNVDDVNDALYEYGYTLYSAS